MSNPNPSVPEPLFSWHRWYLREIPLTTADIDFLTCLNLALIVADAGRVVMGAGNGMPAGATPSSYAAGLPAGSEAWNNPTLRGRELEDPLVKPL
jgi:hypothetical protein